MSNIAHGTISTHERPRRSRDHHSNPGGAWCLSSASVAQMLAAASIKVMDALFGLVARNDAEWFRRSGTLMASRLGHARCSSIFPHPAKLTAPATKMTESTLWADGTFWRASRGFGWRLFLHQVGGGRSDLHHHRSNCGGPQWPPV